MRNSSAKFERVNLLDYTQLTEVSFSVQHFLAMSSNPHWIRKANGIINIELEEFTGCKI